MALQHVATEAEVAGKLRRSFAWDIISDYTKYPAIMENVDDVKIHERNEKYGISEWFVTIEDAPLTWKEKDFFNKENFELRFESISGDFDTINGCWKIELADSGILIKFQIDYDLGIPVIEEVLGHILKEKMKYNIDTMIGAVSKALAGKEMEERIHERVCLNKFHTIHVNNIAIRSSIINISRGGMMISYDGSLDLLNANVRIGGETIASEIILNDLRRKNYRIVFNEVLAREEMERLIKIISHEPMLVQEAVMIENTYETASENKNMEKKLAKVTQ